MHKTSKKRNVKVKSAYFFGAVIWVAVVALVVLYLASRGSYIEIPSESAGVLVKPANRLFGKAEVTFAKAGFRAIEEGRTAVVIPIAGLQWLEFKMPISANLASHLPLVKGQPALLVRGKFEVEAGEALTKIVKPLIVKAVEKGEEVDITPAFSRQLKDALRKEREKRADLGEYSAAVKANLAQQLAAEKHEVSLTDLQISSVEEYDGPAAVTISGLVQPISPMLGVPKEVYLQRAAIPGGVAVLLLICLYFFPKVFLYVTAVTLMPFVAVANLCGCKYGSPWDFDFLNDEDQ